MAEEVELCVEIPPNMEDVWEEALDVDRLCRACANTNESMIPIFEGDGIEHELQAKIAKHLPVKITKEDGLPHQMCFQCASTLVAWHDMFTNCIEAEKKLTNLVNKAKDAKDDEQELQEMEEMEEQVIEEEVIETSIAEDMAIEKFTTDVQERTVREMEMDDDNREDDVEAAREDDVEGIDENSGKKEDRAGTTIRDQFLNKTWASISKTIPERKSTCLKTKNKCMKMCTRFTCNICGRRFLRQICLLFHMKRIHENAKSFKCSNCNVEFKCFMEFTLHTNQYHSDVDEVNGSANEVNLFPIKCEQIEQVDIDETSILHTMMFEGKDPLETNDDTTQSFGAISNGHSLNGGDAGSFQGLEDLDTRNTLIEHLEQSEGNEHEPVTRNSVIENVEQSEGNEPAMSSYYGHVAQPTPIVCAVCSLSFKSTLSLYKHLKADHTADEAIGDPTFAMFKDMYSCRLCNELFVTARQIRRHESKVHGLAESELTVDADRFAARARGEFFTEEEEEKLKQASMLMPDGLTIYNCSTCNMNIMTARRFLNHVLRHENLMPFVCHLCGKQFPNRHRLNSHVKIIHEGIKDFKCSFCDRSFGERKNMIEHERKHTGERPHVCGTCGKTFATLNSIYLHRRRHIKYLPHKCPSCPALFGRRQQRDEHVVRRHGGEKRFVCDVCDKRFAVKTSLDLHRLTHSDAKPFSCYICDMRFKQKKYVKRHISTHHTLKNELFIAMNQ